MRRAWFCDGCDKEYTMKTDAKACEQTHEPFIRVTVLGLSGLQSMKDSETNIGTVEFPVKDEFVLFHPKHGDIVIEIASLIESINTNEAGPVWIPRFHVEQAKAETEASDEQPTTES